MPIEFDKCRASGGKIRTKTINAKQYAHVCIYPDGKTVMGDIKNKVKPVRYTQPKK